MADEWDISDDDGLDLARLGRQLLIERLRTPVDHKAAAEARRAEIEAWSGLLGQVLDRVDRWLAIREAAAKVKPRAAEKQPAKQAPDYEAVLARILTKPPPAEAAEELRAAGFTRADVPQLVETLSALGDEWRAWVEGAGEWVAAVEAQL